ncbi:MAG TPA: peptidylprolyl isomerase [Verrucomicrobiae bacterium]|nr:peptidylprolyl isomerase [Verrucomicrobiae bacterium]
MKNTVLAIFVVLTGLISVERLSAQATNSMVRFRFAYGGARLGDVDVELFDQDKPITVSNFLAYVQSGAYDNTMVTRVIPDFVLQGGEFTIANPYSSAPFELVTRIPTFSDITNEFSVGTRRSNVFGTIAMARINGAPNSANSSWFFNLTNNAIGTDPNSNLDLHDGGFTVFGQIKTGQSLLNSFNSYDLYNRVLDLADGFHIANCAPIYEATNAISFGPDAVQDVPVAYRGQYCPIYSDLLTVQILQTFGPDLVAPKLAITSPTTTTVTNSNVLVAGTATDALGVASVRVYLNTNGPVIAQGSNTWSLTLTNTPPGTNTIDVEATDLSGNRSHMSRTFFHSVRVPLTLMTLGPGRITGATNGQLLELTRPYTLTAQPDPGNLFGIWTGSFSEVSTTLKFNMETNSGFTAIFTSNLFPYAKGVYNGLFYETNQAQQQSSGFLTLTLGDLGAYSGKLLMNGRTFRLSGSFGVDGGETNTVLLSDSIFDSTRLIMHVDLAGGDQITGEVTNRLWRSQLHLDRIVFNAATNPAPWAGNYTFVLPVDTNGVPGPEGESYGTVKVDTKGGATLKGVLADSTPLTFKTTLSKNGTMPLYLALYKGLGALISWTAFDTNQPTTDVSGLINWFKQTQVTAKFYGRGFTNEMSLQGSRYAPPATGRVVAMTNATVGFTNGNQAGNFANDVTLGDDNKFINNSTNKLTLTISKASGLLSGTVTPPGSTRSLPFKGALLLKQTRGAGFLAGSNRTTQVHLNPAP